MLLSECSVRDKLIITSVLKENKTAMRLSNIGIEKGTQISVVRALKGNKAMIISLLGKAVILSKRSNRFSIIIRWITSIAT